MAWSDAVDWSVQARRLENDLRRLVLPYWHDTAIDWADGGYLPDDAQWTVRRVLRAAKARILRPLRIHGVGPLPAPAEKHVVAQSRLLYVFSLAHQRGLGTGGRNYLRAAEHGYRFLVGRMLDRDHGGCFWRVDRGGLPLDATKRLYGQAFAIYGLCEYHRASGDAAPLAHAARLFRTVQERMRDRTHGGWIEHLGSDFASLPDGTTTAEAGFRHITGRKTAGAHLHWMEALAELADLTDDGAVRDALREVVKVNTSVFFARPSGAPEDVTTDWRPIQRDSAVDSHYGHNLEFTWLLLRAQHVLGIAPSIELVRALVTHALRYGFDWQRGGFYTKGSDHRPPPSTDKLWWVQAEGLAALTQVVAMNEADNTFKRALGLLLHWISAHQRGRDGIWLWSTDERGRPRNTTKAGSWKAGYHEVRAMCRFIDAFSTSGGPMHRRLT
jgi:mannose/cellobiose epimerase-like protein (N-acyl-D-glucosamine 2-epimerase family)